MRKYPSLLAFLCLMMVMACGTRKENMSREASIDMPSFIQGDSMVYGLVCDGGNDTILVVLRNIYGDPDTFNILDATRQHQVFGRPKVGDQIVLLVDSDSTVARMAIDLDRLTSTWCYDVKPTLRQRAGVSEGMRQQFLQQMSDSVRDSLFATRQYGFTLKVDGTVRTIGMRFNDDNSPVTYPDLKRYGLWSLVNGRLVLTETRRDSLGNSVQVQSDTARLILLRRDTLALQFPDGTKGYYRDKKDEK